jgi:hypothetical protein
MSDKVFTTSEVAQSLNITDRHVRRLCDELNITKQGKSYVITYNQLEAIEDKLNKRSSLSKLTNENENLKTELRILKDKMSEAESDKQKELSFLSQDNKRLVKKVGKLTNENDELSKSVKYYKDKYAEYEDVDDIENIIEVFSLNEYSEFERIIKNEPIKNNTIKSLNNEVKILSNQLDYMRESMRKKETQLSKVIDSIVQRNYIEAKEKGLE